MAWWKTTVTPSHCEGVQIVLHQALDIRLPKQKIPFFEGNTKVNE